MRLIGFQRVELEPQERRIIKLTADPRLLGAFDETNRRWRIQRGVYRVFIGKSAGELSSGGEATVAASSEH